MKRMILSWTTVLLLAASANALAMDMGGVTIHGFISQGFLISNEYNYLSHKSTDGSFEYNEMGINFSKELTDKLRVGVQFFARDIGDAAKNKVTLDWAYGDYRFRDWLAMRAGKIKMPYGLYNEIRDYDFLRTSIVMPQTIYNDLLRDTVIALNGVGPYGNVPIGRAGSIDYFGLTGALDPDLDSGYGKWVTSNFTGSEISTKPPYTTSYIGMLKWNTPLPGFMVGGFIIKTSSTLPLSLANGSTLSVSAEAVAWSVGMEYAWRNLLVSVEYFVSDAETEFILIDNQGIPQPRSSQDPSSEQYYLSASYRFTDWFELGAYYSPYYPNSDDKDGNNFKNTPPSLGGPLPDHLAWQKDIALSCRFDITEGWTFKIEGHKVDGAAQVLAVDNPDRSEPDWYYGAANSNF
ncbi:MAG: porin [Desulfatitalea sp.]|nr:porin [Desulfatitalea sp.]NNK00611.1 porin [Desulfatitalea sp.]